MDIVKSVKRIVTNLFPEINAGYHLPMFAEVVGVRETTSDGDLCDEFRPRYAVDVQILNEYGEPNTKWPVLKDVILSVPTAGHEVGHFAYPESGTWVEIAFAYGSPNRPFIRSVLPHRLTMPAIERGEQRWQQNPESYQRIDKDGNHQRVTDSAINDRSLTRVIEALDVLETFHQSAKRVEATDTETIGAIKRIEAFGAVVVQSGGVLDLSAADSLRLTTKADAIINSLQNQSLKAPKTWIGSDSENLFVIVSELAQLTADVATSLAGHSHASHGAKPTTFAKIELTASDAETLKNRVDGITK